MKSIYKMLITFVVLIFLTSSAIAQIDWQANFFIQPFPSPYIADWEYDRSLASLTINNYSGSDVDVIAYVTIRRQSGEFVGSVNSNPVSIPQSPPPTILSSEDIFDWDSAEYDASLREIIIRTGRLPEGNFEACARLENQQGEMLLEEICAFFTIVLPDPPMLLMPMDQDTISLNFQSFQWTPVILPAGFQVLYSIQIVEVFEGQMPEQAMQANPVHHEDQDLISNLYQYPIDGLPFEPAKQYAWQVQVLDQHGMPAVSNEGRSQIWSFFTPDTTTHDDPDEPGERNISGVLTDLQTQLPVSGATIVYHQLNQIIDGDSIAYQELPESLATSTNNDGYFSFPDVSDSNYFSLVASKPGYIDEEYISYEYQTIGDVHIENIFITADYADIYGRVAQAHIDQPISDAFIELWQREGNGDPGGEDELILSSRSDDDGRTSANKPNSRPPPTIRT